jgi:hypothetical protein
MMMWETGLLFLTALFMLRVAQTVFSLLFPLNLLRGWRLSGSFFFFFLLIMWQRDCDDRSRTMLHGNVVVLLFAVHSVRCGKTICVYVHSLAWFQCCSFDAMWLIDG